MEDLAKAWSEYLQAHPNFPDNADPNKLQELKRHFIRLTCFRSGAGSCLDEFKLVRSILEANVILAVRQESLELFERDFGQLLPVYFAIQEYHGEISNSQSLIFAMGLMCHLCRDRLENFHLLLRRAMPAKPETGLTFFGHPASKVLGTRDHELIDFVTGVERDLMEGNLTKVLNLIRTMSAPDKSLHWFLKSLVDALRWRMARSVESSYEDIPIDALTKMMAFQDREELLNYLRQEGKIGLGQGSQAPVVAVQLVEQIPQPRQPFDMADIKANQATTPAFMSTRYSYPSEGPSPLGLTTEKTTNYDWIIKEANDRMAFKAVSKSKPLIAAPHILAKWLDYGRDIETIV